MEKLKPGAVIWIPCEVKPGPFSNERSVRVQSSGGSWVGFVDIRFLKEPVASGPTFIKAKVLSVEGDRLIVSLPGHPVDSSRVRVLEGDEVDAVTLDPVPA